MIQRSGGIAYQSQGYLQQYVTPNPGSDIQATHRLPGSEKLPSLAEVLHYISKHIMQ